MGTGMGQKMWKMQSLVPCIWGREKHGRTSIKLTLFFCALVYFALLTGCTFDGVRNVTVVDNNGEQIKDILVIPLYSKSFGLFVGPDGKKLLATNKRAITKPFLFNSGDDLMSKKEATKGLMLPLIIFAGKINAVDRWLFLKRNFTPLVLSDDNIYGRSPAVMINGSNSENRVLIDMLLAPNRDQNALKRMLGLEGMKEDIKVDFDENDLTLLGALISKENG